jgi:carbon storage regulator CsrA
MEAQVLVLSRKVGEITHIGDTIEVVVLEVNGGRVKLGFSCPREVVIRRGDSPAAAGFAATSSKQTSHAVSAVNDEPGRAVAAPLRKFRAATSRA